MRMRATIAAALIGIALAACGQGAQEPPPAPAEARTQDPVAQANTTFESWTLIGGAVVADAAVEAPDGSSTADTLTLSRADGIAFTHSGIGANVTARVVLWGQEGQNVALQLVNWCRNDASQVVTSNIVLTGAPAEYEISNAFPAEDCVRFQIILTDNNGVVNAWNPRIERS